MYIYICKESRIISWRLHAPRTQANSPNPQPRHIVVPVVDQVSVVKEEANHQRCQRGLEGKEPHPP